MFVCIYACASAIEIVHIQQFINCYNVMYVNTKNSLVEFERVKNEKGRSKKRGKRKRGLKLVFT